jgi:DDE superfamily endonuclease/Helix-turn-helix of DDE superfamily endonuclease
VLAYLRKGETFAELAAGFGVGTATAWRYVTETVALLAGRSPKLRQARAARKAGHAYLVLDGTLITIDRVAADRPFSSGKHRRRGMNLQVIASPDGDIVWVSGPLPGAVHDLTAARIWGIIAKLAACGLLALADKGYLGEEHIRTHTGAGTSPPRRRTPTGLTPGSAALASAPMPSSNPGGSCASSAAAPGAPVSWPRPATSCRPAKSEDETLSLSALSSATVQEVAECAAGGNQRGGHQVDGHPGDAGEVARLVFDAGAGDGQAGEERHPSRRRQ